MSKPIFVAIKPGGFIIEGCFAQTIDFMVCKESMARKLWEMAGNRRHLVCFSPDGMVSRDMTRCVSCSKSKQCQLKLRLHFKMNNKPLCLELPKTSLDNYRMYTRCLFETGYDVRNIVTSAWSEDRGYWGEVHFSMKNMDKPGLI